MKLTASLTVVALLALATLPACSTDARGRRQFDAAQASHFLRAGSDLLEELSPKEVQPVQPVQPVAPVTALPAGLPESWRRPLEHQGKFIDPAVVLRPEEPEVILNGRNLVAQ